MNDNELDLGFQFGPSKPSDPLHSINAKEVADLSNEEYRYITGKNHVDMLYAQGFITEPEWRRILKRLEEYRAKSGIQAIYVYYRLNLNKTV